ncbi:hypothetical protein [Clostridium beijerinckii]|uniref:Uncharacterized protein n=1 Tax=Clostridium beijerinckii TaxID=1520 RepID=A0AAE5H7R1_CLOBE|nr:hypothetical protein [Clostridium beijerinckii]NRT34022.1 hypothetical protein [Clostridium beijerinckii]NRT46548.1 hypothetical protein [Clostridium beijerinckii]NRZ19447.1 hypothetical protein [Clostridium beijerinckii]NSB15931.1 hypothetical protein [Clostridium beijerinckii]OOM33260.1 hypothetical protein CLOBE_05980 [Clostridium beijerinckii]
MSNDVNIVLEEIKMAPKVRSGNDLVVVLSSNAVKLSTERFNEAVEYIWECKLVKILKVERRGIYIAKIYVDVTT